MHKGWGISSQPSLRPILLLRRISSNTRPVQKVLSLHLLRQEMDKRALHTFKIFVKAYFVTITEFFNASKIK